MSKKRSGASEQSSTTRRESVVFFTDRCLGAFDVPVALRNAGLIVEIHKEHFNSDCEDHVWIKDVGARGWIILTKDKSFRSRQIEVAALMQSRTATFVLTSSNTTGPENAKAFIKAIPQMLDFVNRFQPPFLANVTASGSVHIILTHQGMIDLHGAMPP